MARPTKPMRNLTITDTWVALASGQTARNVVGIAANAMRIGTMAIHEANTKASTSSAPPPAINASTAMLAPLDFPLSAAAARSASSPVTCTGAPPTRRPWTAACAARASA
jgi:hypothetical protein